jgi:hypothetical protein
MNGRAKDPAMASGITVQLQAHDGPKLGKGGDLSTAERFQEGTPRIFPNKSQGPGTATECRYDLCMAYVHGQLSLHQRDAGAKSG